MCPEQEDRAYGRSLLTATTDAPVSCLALYPRPGPGRHTVRLRDPSRWLDCCALTTEEAVHTTGDPERSPVEKSLTENSFDEDVLATAWFLVLLPFPLNTHHILTCD